MTFQEFQETDFNKFPNNRHLFFILKSSEASIIFPVYISREDDTDDLIFEVVGRDSFYTKEELLENFIYSECRKFKATVVNIVTEKAFIEEYLEN